MIKNEDKKLIEDMKAHIFTMAVDKWNLSGKKCAEIFEKNKLFNYIERLCKTTHIKDYIFMFSEVEDFLKNNKSNTGINLKNETRNEVKSFIATNTLKMMVSDYANGNQKKFDGEFLKFTKSKTYKCLFDFDTTIWKEGPVYLNCIYKDVTKKKR